LITRGETQQQVKARLGLDEQLWHFASNLTCLDAHFFTAAELLLQQEGRLVQQAAQLLEASAWSYYRRRLQEPHEAASQGIVTWGPYKGVQAPAAAPAGTGYAGNAQHSQAPSLQQQQAGPAQQVGPAAGMPPVQQPAGQAAGAPTQSLGRYQQPSSDLLISSCGWVGLRPA
jgi:hypothetical protein